MMLLMKALKLGKAESTLQLLSKKHWESEFTVQSLSWNQLMWNSHTFPEFTQDVTAEVSTN